MKFLLFSLIVVGFFYRCGSKTSGKMAEVSDTTLTLINQKGKISLDNDSGNQTQYKYIHLDLNEVFQAQQIVKSFLEEEPVEVSWDTKKIDKTTYQAYYKQFTGLKNSANQTVVWINANCNKPTDWKQTWNRVLGGGTCYFNLKVNLDDEKVFDFFVNGPK